jgi:osmotically-inducible protein OsmY
MPTQKTDLALKQDVLAALALEPHIKAATIGVAVDDGVVTLMGHVTSLREKREAEQAAQQVPGVKAVAEEIAIRRPDITGPTDTDIARTVMNTIVWHLYRPEGRIKVKVEHGWVTLEGEVDDLHQWADVAMTVRHLAGVRGVHNLMTMKHQVPQPV